MRAPLAPPTPSSALSRPENVTRQLRSVFSRSRPQIASRSSKQITDIFGTSCRAWRSPSSFNSGSASETWHMDRSYSDATDRISDDLPQPGGPYSR
eukprot:5420002-Prymnesium_polylepis.2